MFVSRKQATDRLSADENLLRPRVDTGASATDEVEVVEGEVEDDSEEPEDIGLGEETVEVYKTPTLSKLDALISGKPRPRSFGTRVRDSQAFAEVADILGKDVASQVLDVPESLKTHPVGSDKLLVERKLRRLKSTVALRTTRKLSKVVKQITDEKIETIENPLELARLGRDLATITQSMSPKEEQPDGGVHFHVYRPELKQENHYETITVGARE